MRIRQGLSYRACTYCKGKFREFGVNYSDAMVITDVSIGGVDQMAMVGHAYFNAHFSAKFKNVWNQEIDTFRVADICLGGILCKAFKANDFVCKRI